MNRAAIKVIYDMAEQTLDRGSYSYEEWPEAWEALNAVVKEVYPDGSEFVNYAIECAEADGVRKPNCFEG